MPLISFVRFFTTLLSLAILAGAGYLLWSWYDGDWVRDGAGVLHHVREEWRLWTGAGLLAWSFLGRSLTLLLLARPDRRPTKALRGEGRMLASPTGSSLYVEAHGPVGAPPIIFTHGWGMDSTFWRYAKEDLGDRFRLILWDLPGLGKSKPGAKDAIALPAFAADLASLIELAGRQRPVLVGHSIGGMTIQTLIRDNPQIQARLAGLVLLNTTYTNPLRTMILSGLATALQPVVEAAMKLTIALQPIAWASKWQSYLSGSAHVAQRLGYGRFVTRSQLEHTTLLSTRSPPAVLARGDLAMFHWDAIGALGRLRIPALVIGGDKDIVTKLEANREIAGESDLTAIEVVEGVNHMGPMERADLYNQMIADFALKVQPSASADVSRPRPTKAPAQRRNPPPPELGPRPH